MVLTEEHKIAALWMIAVAFLGLVAVAILVFIFIVVRVDDLNIMSQMLELAIRAVG